MRIYSVLVLFVFIASNASSQSIEQIKADRTSYIWGEGTGTTINKADQIALDMISTQISVEVESKFSLLKEEVQKAGKSDFKEECHQMVNTYSSATLNNTERIVLGNEPDAKVFRYIKRNDIANIFQQRKQKILDFTANADKVQRNNQVADALKYYYWALSLLRSHPEGNSISYTAGNGNQSLLLSYLPQQINAIFAGLHYTAKEIKDEPGQRLVTLDIYYNDQPVQNLEYSYWDGRDWSALVDAKDGVGFMEFFGDNAASRSESQIRTEYIFDGEARIDRELEDVLKRLDPVPFHNAYYNLKFENASKPILPMQGKTEHPLVSANKLPGTAAFSSIKINSVAETDTYQLKVNQIVEAIGTKQYEKVKPLFTPEGYDVFTRLIAYGKARVLSNDSLRAIRLNNTVICRGPRMSFGFTNNRKFVEDVVFHFNPDGKVETLSFGLNQQALGSILSRTSWSEAERLTIINFMEHYKTAYALKRLDFISSIFADDALIIIGNVVKVKPNIDNPFLGNSIVKFNRLSKTQYLKALEHNFASNEFINLGFEESDIRKGGKEGDMFGIQIKQNYFSENYGDKGYLFLLLDFKNPNEPIIHVRTWQPEKNTDGSTFGIEDF
ncbi:MAG: hypothetical protein WCN92_08270 [Eubacteriales bacterium]